MGYLYALINKTNGKKFLGKSNLEYKLLKQMLYEALDEEKHYNKLLQEDWKKYNFELKQILSDDCSKDFDEIIRGEELLNPLFGYNLFNDLQNKKGRHKKKDFFSEDICLLYLFNQKVQFWTNVLNMERNTLSNRLGNYGLFDDGYYHQSIARYEDYYWTALRILYLDKKCLTANQIMDRMINRYDISTQLRITPRKISKFFAGHGVKSKNKKDTGSLVFCPDFICCDCDEKRRED